MIFKVQRSLMPRDANILIYNQEKSIVYTLPMGDDIRDMMGDKMKGYYNATINKEGRVEFDGTEAAWQTW